MSHETNNSYPPGLYLIRRHGDLFRPGAHGYTREYVEAGFFPRDEAVKYLDVEGVSLELADQALGRMMSELAALQERVAAFQQQIATVQNNLVSSSKVANDGLVLR